MDRIEELMKNADPAKGLPAPGPLNLDATNPDGSHAPTFVPTYVESADDALDANPDNVVWFKKPAVWIAGVAAAAAVGLVIAFNPFAPRGAAPLPAVTAPDATSMSNGASGSAEPSTGGSATATDLPTTVAASPTSNSMNSLPNGLLPAHPSVYWDESPECQAFDISKVMVSNPNVEDPEPLNGSPEDNPVVGCYGGYAAYVGIPDRVFYEQELSDVFTGLYIATWDGDQWLVDHNTNIDGIEGFVQISSYPTLRAFPNDEGKTAAETAKDLLKALRVSVDDPEKLLGPNTASWAPSEPAKSWTEFPIASDGLTGEKRDDWSVVSKTAGMAPALVYETRVFDQHGAYAAMINRHSRKPTASCDDPAATYAVESTSDIRLLAKNDEALALKLVSVTDALGRKTSSFKILPKGTATAGAACDLEQTLDLPDGTFMETTISPTLGFESAEEIDAFKSSQYMQDMTRFAESLSFQKTGQ